MVMRRRAALVLASMMAASGATVTCKVINEEHCANQEVPGNEFCRELNTATPYCSPCNRDFQGCVDFEPFACPGYSDELSEDELDRNTVPMESSTTDAPASTGEQPMSTGETTTTDAASSSGGETTGTGTSSSG